MIYRNIVRKLFSKVYTKEHEWLNKVSDKHYLIGTKSPPNPNPQSPKIIPPNPYNQKYIII